MDPINANAPHPAPASQESRPRILVALPDGTARDRVATLLEAEGHEVECADRLESARVSVVKDRYDLVVVGPALPDGDCLELADLLQRLRPSTKVVVVSEDGSFDAAVEAMRRGAVDFLRLPMSPSSLRLRLAQALGKSRFDQEREQRLLRLRSICRRLNTARQEISQQVDLLCTDLVHAYQEIAGQLNDVAMTSEFRTLLRQELDVEGVLRTALEYLLTKTGPTNAAVFLPGEDGEYNLGAYVNYDCPRETADVMLHHLGERICHQMEHEPDIVRFADGAEFAAYVGSQGEVVPGSELVAFSASHDEECMAVVVLFRDADEPFPDSLAGTLDLLRPLFAEQIATIIRIHHRAQPQWPRQAIDDADDDDWGMAA